ncbi:MAG: (d)CMP kinase [Alphaproteobacteria bacterium]
MTKPIIAIDGPAASGKGTLAKRLASELNFAYLDTGKLYRATAHEILSSGLSLKDKNDARDAAQLLIKRLNNNPAILQNPALASDECGQAASIIAAYPQVRDALNQCQRDFAKTPPIGTNGAILDGRDIGTIIAPNADLKLFITAKTEIRAQRRLKELQSKGISTTYTNVLDDMRMRDERDAGRKDAPMSIAADAIQIDTSDMDAETAFQTALQTAKQTLNL